LKAWIKIAAFSAIFENFWQLFSAHL